MNDATVGRLNYIEQASEIVAAYVAHNHITPAEMPNLIRAVHEALSSLGKPAAAEATAEPLKPAVSVRKSVTDDYIISLEDGRKLKSMKRYLAGLGMTPADYRAKWGLSSDYPMVAPSYAAKRSELARSSGLGRKAAELADADADIDADSEPAPVHQPEAAEPASAPVDEAPAKKRGGRKKAA